MQFAKLKLVSAKVERESPIDLRRNRLTGKLNHQIAAAKAASEGGNYAAKKLKFIKDDETGERKQVEVATRVKHWWFSGSNGKINLAIRYGAKPIELAKGKNAIELANMGEVIEALMAVKEAVSAGELDVQIEQASGALRAGFAKKK
jgi:hypothetical protein